MAERRFVSLCAAFAVGAGVALTLAFPLSGFEPGSLPARATASTVAGGHFPKPSRGEYGPQKIVYHVSTKGSWRGREDEAWRLVAVLNNHLNAIEPDEVDLRVILQGDGIDALYRAKQNPKLADAFDRLAARGVTFAICMNTLEAYRMVPETLHPAKTATLVQTAVAEIAHLQKQGFSYIKF